MRKKCLFLAFVLCFGLIVAATSAWGSASPFEAMPDTRSAIRFTVGVSDAGGLMRTLLSQEVLRAAKPMMEREEYAALETAALLASRLGLGEAALSVGADEKGAPWFVLAGRFADPSNESAVALMEKGPIDGLDVAKALFGEAGLPFGPALDPKPLGKRGVCSALGGLLHLAARDGLLIAALSERDANAALDALEGKGRAPESPMNGVRFLIDPAILKETTAHELQELREIAEPFEKPFFAEYVLSRKGDRAELDFFTNYSNAVAEPLKEKMAAYKPLKRTVPMMLGAAPMLAGSVALKFDVHDLDRFGAEFMIMSKTLWKELFEYGLERRDLDDMLNGELGFAFVPVKQPGTNGVPGVFLTLTPRSGAGTRIFNILVGNEEFRKKLSIVKRESKDWEQLYEGDGGDGSEGGFFALKNGTMVIGVLQDRKFVPADPAFAELYEKPSIGVLYADFERALDYARNHLFGQGSLGDVLAMLAPLAVAEKFEAVLESTLSIPRMTYVQSEIDKGKAVFELRDVPDGEGVLARLGALAEAAGGGKK